MGHMGCERLVMCRGGENVAGLKGGERVRKYVLEEELS